MRFLTGLEIEATSVGVVNVAGGELADELTSVVQQRYGLMPQFVCTTARCGDVVNGYEATEQLGTDRWAAIVGAWEEFKSDVCVVDAGTAVTIDLVNGDGAHLGGFILPGLQLMAASLNSDTSDIENYARTGSSRVMSGDWLGSDTLSAVQRGAQFALCSTVIEAVRAHRNLQGAKPRVVLTGGDAEQLLSLGDCVAELRPELVLTGLRYLLGAQGNA
jgi:type III pantothenate kinase